jgi:hypothetical protein
MYAVPYGESRWLLRDDDPSDHRTPTGESWSFNPILLFVTPPTVEEIISEMMDDEVASWIENPEYRKKVVGFAIISQQTLDMIQAPRFAAGNDSGGDAIANFQVAFCVAHAEYLLPMKAAQEA